MKEILTIFKYVDGENDELFYSSAEPIKLYEYSFSSTRMGSSTISSTLLFPVCLDNLWSGKEYVLFRGTRYFIKNTPSSTKDNTSALYTHSLEFAPETELQLSNVYFIDAVYSGSDVDDKIKTNSTKVIFFGTLAEFAARIEKAISYSGLSGYSVTIDEGVSTDTQQVSFEDKTIFEALQDSFEIYGVPFYFIGKAIHFGHTDNDISQPFKYGVNNELLSIKKNNANYKIVTRITGKGGERNIPYYYPNNSPKGNIKAQALSSNTAITQADINLVNAEKFSNKVDLGASVVYYHGTESVQSWTVNGVPDSGGLHSVTIPTYGPVVEKYVFQLSILSAGIFKISFDMWIQYVGTVYPIGDLISRYVLKNKDTGDSLSLTPIDSDKSTEYFLTPWLAEGDYELEIDFTLRFQGHQEYTYSLTPNIDSDYGWAVIATDGSGKVVELNDIGVEITKAPSVGDGFTQVSLGSMPASTVLLPPIYRETSGEERFYDAENNTYVIPGTEDYYQFENQFSDSYPKEHIFSDDSIYPTINGITNASGQEIGRFLQVAFDENDNDETVTSDDGSTENYVHPYFFVKLPKFDGSWGFNLFDHAIESGEMEIVMTSGNCNGCHFVIGVDESSQKNLVQVDASGNLLRDEDGDVRCGRDGKPGETPQYRQNDTRTNEVWIALKKDISTFGVIMPNATNNYRPLAADKFVIINILLPQAYIEKAENELKEASIKYMAENNSEKFNFSVSFSRIYLATHPEIAGLIDENARLRITYNGATYPFYVSQFTYKAIADESLPEIGVELSEAITVNKGILQNTVDEIKGDISKINTSIDPARSMRSYFLLKNQNDETSGIVRFISGILLGSASSSNSFGFNINNLGGVDGILSNLTLYGGSQNGNAALNLVNGVVAGLRHTVKRITGDATLTSDDYIVLASSESAATITLPEIPQNGQMYRIYSTSAAGITIYGNGRPIYRTGSTVALTQSVISASSGLVDIFYSFSGGGWYLSAPDTELFELVNIGTEENPLMAIRAKYGLFSDSFISARGSDPEAGSGGSGGGLDVQAMWYALGQPTSEKINVTHIPELSISKITGLQAALDSKLEGITKAMVEGVLTGTITSHNHDGMYAPLSGGLIPSQYLPSYVDDVVEYASLSAFPATGEGGKIYVALDTNLTYRWGGSGYVEISPSLALGHTSSTAYPGDEGAANASAIQTLQSYFSGGAAKRVAHALTLSFADGAPAVYDGSAAVEVTVPTEAQMTLWDRICALFDIDEDGNVYVKDNRGFWSNSFISARGSDPEAGSGGGSGADMASVWYALGQPTNEKINVSHIPELTISKISGLQDELDSKLSGITSDMVKGALGYTPYDASQIGSASVAYAASAGKVENALTINNDGGSSSASAKTYNGSAAVMVTIPTTLPASDVYAWAKAATKPSYTWSEIGGKPTEFTPAPHTHVKADITDFPTSWAWSAITGKPSTLAGYGIKDGVNAAEAAGHLTASVSGHKLTIGVASGYTIPTASQITLWDKICALFDVDTEGNVYVTGSKGFYSNSFISARGSDPEAGSGGSGGGGLDVQAMWYALGQPTTEKINASHIPALQQLSGQITNAQLANSSLSVAGVSVSLGGSVSTAQIASALTTAGYKLTDTIYTLPKATVSALGGIKAAGVRTSAITTTQGGTTSGRYYGVELDSNGKAFVNVPWANTTYSLSSFGVTATAAEINKLDGLATTAKELGYVHGVTSNIQTQLNGKANTSALSAYLPLAGGTLTGHLISNYTGSREVITINGISTGAYIRIAGASDGPGAVGMAENLGMFLECGSGNYINIKETGDPLYKNTYPLLHSANYTNYTVTKTGVGASGTWPISVSGSSNTLISTTVTAISNYVRYRSVSGTPSLVGSTAGGGAWGLPSTGPDAEYANGQILRLGWSPEYYTDIFTGPNDFGSAAGIQFRQIVDGKMASRGWRTLLDTANYAGYLDSRYLQKSSYTAADILAKLKTVDGSGSGLDADLLDGYQATGLSRLLSYINSGTKTAAGWYRVFSASSNRTNALGVNIILHLARSFNYNDNEAYTFCISVAYNNQVDITQVSGLANVRLITKIRVVSVNSGALYVDFYLSRSTNGNTYYITGSGPGTFQEAAAVSAPGGNVTEFTTVNGCKSSGGFTGALSGNATSATKLATVRSIWGQSFDGNGNVNGYIYLDSQSHRIFFGTSGTTAYLCAGDGYFTINRGTDTSYAANLLRINLSNGAVGINAVPSAMLHVGGTGYFSSNLEVSGTIHSSVGIWSNGYVSAKGQDTTSDARYKKDVAALPAQAALAVLMRLRPSTWEWKDDGRRGAGFVAQEVLGVLPEAVREVGGGEDRHLALNYQMLHAYEVCLLQNHETELERLRGRVNQLENEIKRIQHGS